MNSQNNKKIAQPKRFSFSSTRKSSLINNPPTRIGINQKEIPKVFNPKVKFGNDKNLCREIQRS